MPEKLFPIQSEQGERNGLRIPWSVAEVAYEEYCRRYGNRQTLERLAKRGGFGRGELLDLLNRPEE